jgi:uncharacterized protein YndB with AHSA1/START domain
MPWELKHSVIADAPRETVWEFVSDIDNLARVEGDAVESMTLDGPFQAGTRGATKVRGQEPTHWRLTVVEPPERATYEMELSGAVLRFAWTYEDLTGGRTRMSQHIMLEGPGAGAYVPLVEQYLAPNAVQGMERLAEEVVRYAGGR